MKKLFLGLIFAILLVTVLVESAYIFQNQWFKKNIIEGIPIIPRPLLSYTFENLRNTEFPVSQITLGPVVGETEDSFQQMFYFDIPKSPGSKETLRVSGLINIPKGEGEYPVIVMFRGFVPDEIFEPGAGTQPSASEFVKNGFITLAPDFLGFGESASESALPFEGRFQTYTTALTLLESLQTLNDGLDDVYVGTISADLEKVGLWGHSNGGHIALVTLAISGGTYPTVLWAPVSKSFPYSILFYTDETDDQGKELRKALSDFEELYDTKDFSPERYYKWIKAPVQIHQGTGDEEIPHWWTDELVEILEENDIDVTYLKYSGANHNLLPNGWSSTVESSIEFYNQQFSLQ